MRITSYRPSEEEGSMEALLILIIIVAIVLSLRSGFYKGPVTGGKG